MDVPLKKCMKCKRTKRLDLFYRHPQMADGHLNKCKCCTKKDVKANYAANREARAEYERRRWKDARRRALAAGYQRARRARNPGKDRARSAVGNAIRDGRLTRGPCEVCGTTEQVQAHHPDYRKPLEVHWLCFKHHRELAHGQNVVDHR